jgi:hypothetical protein
MSIYQEEGFNTRREYLASLAEDYSIPESVVFSLAGLLGASEDFDGLVTACEDFAEVNFN